MPGHFDFKKLMEGTIRQLETEADYFSSLTAHNPEKGRLNETHLVKTLRRYLPPKFGIGTGFIVAAGSPIIESSQCDIIIYDAVNNAPFYSSDAWQIYPIEMVYAVIEVKTTLTTTELTAAFGACARLRRMCVSESGPNKGYLRQRKVGTRSAADYSSHLSKLPPRFYVFGYGGLKRTTLKSSFELLSRKAPGAHVHGLCVLDGTGSMFIQHIPFAKGAARISPVEDNGLWKFLMNLPRGLNSMLPVTELATSNEEQSSFCLRPESFDLVDIDRYKI
jgi:uncharacterized protein DUF6602